MANEFVLTAITADPETVLACDAAGVDRIGIDIERIGKLERQRNVPNAKFSSHDLDDLAIVAGCVRNAHVFVRLNPLHPCSRQEIDQAIRQGAHVLMLPYFNGASEAQTFVELVGGRAAPVLLLETAAAADSIAEVASVPGIAEIAVGLNDLHLSLGLPNLFDVVVTPRMAEIAGHVRKAGVRFGFGGLARIGDPTLPVDPDLIAAQYARLGATSAWLSRSFFAGLEPACIGPEVTALRRRLRYWARQSPEVWERKRLELARRLGN